MNGIDVSANNGNIDWNKVKQNVVPIDFVFIKSSEGIGYTDPKFLTNAKECNRVGIKCGYYHFASLNTLNDVPDAKAEADYFLSVIKNAPAPKLPIVLDIETNKVGLDKPHVLEWINTFFNELKLKGYNDYALYSYTPFLNSNLTSNHGLGNIKLWIAAYTNTPSPKLPVGWDKYWIWQYSSNGKIFGINGNVDLNKTINPIF